MTFQKYNITDNASANLDVGISASSTTINLGSGQGTAFPNSNFILRLVQYTTTTDPTTPIIKDEDVLVTNRSGDVLTVTRGFDGSTPTLFDPGDFLYLTNHSQITKDIQDELTRLENDKANDSTTVHKTGNETIAGNKTFTGTTNTEDINAADIVADSFSGDGSLLTGVTALPSTSTQIPIIAGDNITAGQPVSITDVIVNQPTGNSQNGFLRNTTTSYEVGQSFTLSGSVGLSKIITYMLPVGSPNQIMNMEVYSGIGTGLVATSTNNLDASTLVGAPGGDEITFNFSGQTLNAGTYYFKLNYISGTLSGTNYPQYLVDTGNLYSGGNLYYSIDNLNNWPAVPSQDLKFRVLIDEYSAVLSHTQNTNFSGFADETKTAGQIVKVNTSGTDDNQTGLIPGKRYYLTTTPGVITDVVGAKGVGTALLPDTILVQTSL